MAEKIIKRGKNNMTARDSGKYRHYLLPRKEDEFTIYTRPDCHYCKRALDALTSLRDKNGQILKFINYDYSAVFSDGNTAVELTKIIGKYSYVPIVFHKGEFIGGSDDLIKLLQEKYGYEENRGEALRMECAKLSKGGTRCAKRKRKKRKPKK